MSNTRPDPYTLPHHLWSPEWRALLARGGWMSSNSPVPGILSVYEQHLPFACAICKRGRFTKTKLNRCTGCKIVRYCGQEHQRRHWDEHKLICKDLKQTATLSKTMSPVEPGNYDTYRQYIATGCSVVLAKSTNSNGALISVWNRQAHCLLCYSTDKLNHSCASCGAVALCSTCHGTTGGPTLFQDQTVHSQSDCDNWSVLTAMQGMTCEQEHPLCIDTEEPEPNFWSPQNWDDFFQRKSQAIAQNQMGGHGLMLQLAPVVAMVADGLSTPLTIVRGLVLAFGADKVAGMTDIVIHMVGAGVDEIRSTKRYMEISHCLPALRRLKIVMVGPWLPSSVTNEPIGADLRGVRDYRCTATHDLIKSSYEEYMNTGAAETPTFVIAQHSGVEEQNGADFASEWDPAIARLCEMNVPCMFTGYTLQETQDGVERLKNDVNITQEATINPLRGLGPLPDSAHAGWYFANASYFMFQGLGGNGSRFVDLLNQEREHNDSTGESESKSKSESENSADADVGSKDLDYTQQSDNYVACMSFEVQNEFEQADLQADNEWFKKNWPIYSQGMGKHVLMSYPVFKWVNFLKWCEANPTTFGTQKLLEIVQTKAAREGDDY